MASCLFEAPQGLASFVALGSAVAFTFAWHVHEKAILMVLVPLLALAPKGELGKALELDFMASTRGLRGFVGRELFHRHAVAAVERLGDLSEARWHYDYA